MIDFNVFYYIDEYEWIVGVDGVFGLGIVVIIGIIDYVVDKLGDVVFVELFVVGIEVMVGFVVGEIELIKLVGELYVFVFGMVVEINDVVVDDLFLVNFVLFEGGWLFKVEVVDGVFDGLFDCDVYVVFMEG